MKKIIYIFAAIIVLGQVSCGKFLKETSGDLIVPKNVTHFMDLLNGEGYPKDFVKQTSWFKLMTDDVDMGPTHNDNDDDSEFDSTVGGDGLWPFRWDINIEEKIIDEAWSKTYEYILGCNTVIEALPTMEYDKKAEKDMYDLLAASAYALRAYHYFCLVNWYAAPYNKANLDKPGVIIKTSSNVTLETLPRSTIGEVYELINSDIEKALTHAKTARARVNKFVMSESAVKFIANRIALFQEKWDDVISVGEEFMIKNPTLLSLKAQDQTKFGISYTTSKGYPFSILNIDNPEIIFTYAKAASSSPYEYLTYNALWGLGFMASESLISLYEDNDLRKIAYYTQDVITYKWDVDEDGEDIKVEEIQYKLNYPLKYYSYNQNKCYMMNWRNVEVLLNLAEAYTRKSTVVSEEAVKWLNVLRTNRYGADYTPITVADFASKEELLDFVWEERRRELSFEETMRFWDIRRQGCKSITHKYYITLTEFDTYVLPENSPNFTLQIPSEELDFNNNIETNPREEIIKLK